MGRRHRQGLIATAAPAILAGMNYLAHGFRFVDRPYFLAGTAVPDWLSVCDRSLRIRAADVSACPTGAAGEICSGIAQHLADDEWFHSNPVFEDVCRQIAQQMRREFPQPKNFRASFLAHVLTELILDNTLIEGNATLIDRYYDALSMVSDDEIEAAIAQFAGRVPDRLRSCLQRFRESQFLKHYGDDAQLLRRLSQVVQRAGLPALPADFDRTFPAARRLVAERAAELLPAV
ncbi:MAG: hypothetical protein AAF581_08220 [Planctomycetota bacterium]